MNILFNKSVSVYSVHLLHHLSLGHIQVTAADPLDLKPVFIPIVSTALELYLQHVHCALQEAPSRRVRVLIEPHGLRQSQVQRLLQLPTHAVTHQGPHQHAEGEEEGAYDVGQHDELPAQELGAVHAVVADLPTQEVYGTGDEAHSDQHVGDVLDVPLSHQLLPLVEFHLKEEAQAE